MEEEEEYFTQERLSQFAINYKKFTVLWCTWHPKYADQVDRARAYRRLAEAQGVPRGIGITKRMVRFCQYFHARVKIEVGRMAAARGADAAREALARAPEWAVAAERYLCLKPFANQPTPNRAVRRLARGMRRAARLGAELDARAAALLAPRLRLTPARASELWRELQQESWRVVRAHVARGDVPGVRAPSALQWAVADLAILRNGADVSNDGHYQKVETLQALLGTFHLVQQYGLETAAAGAPAAWRRAARIYSRKGAAASALLLQRRWFELKLSTRRRLRPAPAAPGAAAPRALPLHRDIAERYPHVLEDAGPAWDRLRRERRLARPTRARGPPPGETFCLGLEDSGSEETESDSEDNDENNDDVILVEREIETIDVDAEDSGAESAAPRVRVKSEGAHEPEDNGDSTDGKHFDADGKEDGTIGIFQEVPNTVDDAVKIQEIGCVGEQTDGNMDLAAVEETKADDTVDVKNVARETVDENMDTKDKDDASRHSDKTVDDSRGIMDVNKTEDPDVWEALQKLDAGAIQALIMFESDDDDGNVKDDAEPSDEKHIKDETVDKRSETEGAEGSKKVNKVPGPKSKTLQGRITFESDEDDVNVKSESDSSPNERLETLNEVSDSRLNNASPTGLVVNNAGTTPFCNENLNTNKYRAKKRPIDESSESDSDNLVIDDVADARDDDDGEEGDADAERFSDEDANTNTFNTSSPASRYPTLAEMLKSKSDDMERSRRFQEAKRHAAEEQAPAPPAPPQRPDERQFDPKLLMIPVVALTRIDAPRPKPPPLPLNMSCFDPTLPPRFVFHKHNRRLLRLCRPCAVLLPRPRARVAKRVRLPDIETVRRNNRGIATAQVAPISLPREGAVAGADADSDSWHAEDDESTASSCNSEPPSMSASKPASIPANVPATLPTSKPISLPTSKPASLPTSLRASKPARVPTSKSASVPASMTEAERVKAGHRKANRAPRDRIAAGKNKKAKRNEPEPAPAPPPRSPSPYDEQRALREWLRQKSIGAEKFGIKPRSYKRLAAASAPAPESTPAPAPARSIVTMNRAGELNPPVLLNNRSPLAHGVDAHYVLDPHGAVVSAPGAAPAKPPARLARPARAPGDLNTQMQIVVTGGASCIKMAPKFFNLNAVASINRTLNDLAAHDAPSAPSAPSAPFAPAAPPAPPARATPSCLPVITRVESLAEAPGAAGAGPGAPRFNLWGGNVHSPPRPLTQSGQTTITPVPAEVPNRNPETASVPNSQNIMLSGNFLNAQSGFVLRAPSSPRAGGAGGAGGATGATGAAGAADSAPLLLRSLALLPRAAPPLQVNSVRAGPPQTGSLVIAPQLVAPDSPGVLWTTLGAPDAPLDAAVQSHLLRLSAPGPAPPAPPAPAAPPAPPAPRAPRAAAPPGPRAPTKYVGPKLYFEQLKPTLGPQLAREWVQGRDPTALSVLAAGPGPLWRVAGHLVLSEAAAPRATPHYYSLDPLRRLVLPEEEDIQKRKQDKIRRSYKVNMSDSKPGDQECVSWLKVKSFANMSNSTSQETEDDKTKEGNAEDGKAKDNAAGHEVLDVADSDEEDTDSAEETRALRAPPRVYLENKIYVKMCEAPLIFAKVLYGVSGPQACRALLLRREPALLYSLRARTVTAVYAEPSPDSSSITLTAAKDVFGVLHELASYLALAAPAAPAAPALPPPPPPPPPPPRAPPRPRGPVPDLRPLAPAPMRKVVRPGDPALRAKFSKLMKYMTVNPNPGKQRPAPSAAGTPVRIAPAPAPSPVRIAPAPSPVPAPPATPVPATAPRVAPRAAAAPIIELDSSSGDECLPT